MLTTLLIIGGVVVSIIGGVVVGIVIACPKIY